MSRVSVQLKFGSFVGLGLVELFQLQWNLC